jgi:hypothetical protein
MSAVDEAREAGRTLANEAGPISDPVVVARVAALIHAAMCNTSTQAETPVPSSRTGVSIDTEGPSSRERLRSG